MADPAPDEVARDLARVADRKADSAAAAGTMQWQEARKDIERLDGAVKDFKTDSAGALGAFRTEVTQKFDKLADSQRNQFIAIIGFLAMILAGIVLRAMHVLS